jgi:hypothetical protein
MFEQDKTPRMLNLWEQLINTPYKELTYIIMEYPQHRIITAHNNMLTRSENINITLKCIK